MLKAPIPSVPEFDEELSAVADRARKLVSPIRCARNFDKAHQLIAKILSHDEERRQKYLKWGFRSDTPKFDAGIERRRLLILNALFTAASGLGCQPTIGTSKYAQDSLERRGISIKAGGTAVGFTLEPTKTKKDGQKERLCLAFGMPHSKPNVQKSWEDSDEATLESQLTEILIEILIQAERSYREGLVRHREWVIERKADAEEELRRRKEEAERKARELREKQERERIERLLSQAKALDRANQIRAYVDAALARAAEIPASADDVHRWAKWAREQANKLDPINNGTAIASTIAQARDG